MVDFKDLLEARRETKLVEDTGRLVSVRGSLCLKRRNEIDRDAQQLIATTYSLDWLT